MVASFLCIFGFLILVLSASWLQWALFSGLQFLGAKNSESCLIKAQCICESNKASLFQSLSTSFRFLTLKLNISTIKFMS
ncbi:hypothetical protein ACP52Y_004271 [Vibrio vulnificus]|nr:hypothetical protein [Vibrio vulnificus]MCU8273612.1 hypothetical protein [Vibrio vulnificus]MCU8553740.1 hypothetical protein [Vibrio vulnificus]RZQ30382.1 hypothetical protein D8T38_22290 [Vibrio vulnificus]HAS8411917.1 hypothetical protein [Vibrio vulnificus]HAS8590401.1 hypothetical protein [Vibrio vulnificus]